MAPIEGVATATAGFVGRAASGPVGEARLVTSVVEFAAVYGGVESTVKGHNCSSLNESRGHRNSVRFPSP